MPWIEGNDIMLHYRIEGPADASPLVLIHELGDVRWRVGIG